MGFSFLHEVEDPGEGFIQDGSFERVSDELPLLAGGDEAGPLQEIKVIGNARGAHGKGAADLAGGEVALAEHFKDAPASLILKGLELEVHGND
jgi:hypothetical protein